MRQRKVLMAALFHVMRAVQNFVEVNCNASLVAQEWDRCKMTKPWLPWRVSCHQKLASCCGEQVLKKLEEARRHGERAIRTRLARIVDAIMPPPSYSSLLTEYGTEIQ
jgi:hypothetical protein